MAEVATQREDMSQEVVLRHPSPSRLCRESGGKQSGQPTMKMFLPKVPAKTAHQPLICPRCLWGSWSRSPGNFGVGQGLKA